MHMARMIPPSYADDTSKGEKRVFDLLQNDPETKEWIVLHSYGISRHKTKRIAEIDMVILVPDLGVLCVEVKGSRVSRHEGVWDYGYKTSREGPFRQASSAMHALIKSVAGHYPSCQNILFWSGVIFTAQAFQEKSPEWHSWQCIDGRDLSRRPISNLVITMLEKAHSHSASRRGSEHWYDDQGSRSDRNRINNLLQFLRGDFEAVLNPKDMVRQAEQSIERLTEEQYSVLDAVEENDRILVNGLAGTGKTVLAIEAARRASLSGLTVILVCFNRLLGEWMADVTAGITAHGRGSINARHIHGLMREIARSPVPAGAGSDFWATELPEQALLRLWESESAPKYDVLIVDEAQDILSAEYLDVLSELLVGGLTGGRWLIFGDFNNQAIYLENPGCTGDDLTHTLAERAPHHTSYRLSVNCRNAEKIAVALTLVCNLHPGYRKTIHDLEGAEVEPLFWKDDGDQQHMLSATLRKLRTVFGAQEIVVLSTRRDSDSCAGRLAQKAMPALAPLRTSKGAVSGIPYVTIHAFKGLEAPAVVVTDITTLVDEQRALLYVAMSRARIRLVLMMHDSCRGAYKQLYIRNLGPNAGGGL